VQRAGTDEQMDAWQRHVWPLSSTYLFLRKNYF
jgi:hypothetical protein